MEDNKDLMTVENEDLETVEETEEAQKSGSGGYLLIGALIGAGAYALGRKAIGWWKNRKAKEATVEKTDPKIVDITPDPVDSDEETE